MTEKIGALSEEIMKYTFRTLMPNSTAKAGILTKMNMWAKRAKVLETIAGREPIALRAIESAQIALNTAGQEINTLKSEVQRLQEIIYAASVDDDRR